MTATGRQFRGFMLLMIDVQFHSFDELGTSVAKTDLVWGAVADWGAMNNAAGEKAKRELVRFMARIPAEEREAVEKAAAEVFGRG